MAKECLAYASMSVPAALCPFAQAPDTRGICIIRI